MSAAARHVGTVPLGTLLAGIAAVPRAHECTVTDLTLDSRRVEPGSAFVALAGTRGHGLDHVEQAVAAGATAVLFEPASGLETGAAEAVCRRAGVALVPVPGLAVHVSELAGRIHGQPSRRLRCIGVTGTDGKTSVTQFLAAALDETPGRCGVLGTLGAGFPGALVETGMTTPDAATTQALLRDLLDRGAACVAMEVSSHALVQHRIAAVAMDTAVLTNLGRDHLDYHGGPAAYAEAKTRLFRSTGLRHAVLNLDDALGRRLRRELLAQGIAVTGYSLDGDSTAEVVCTSLRATHRALRLTAVTPTGPVTVELPLLGRFNGANLLAVIATLAGQGLAADAIAERLTRVQAVPGRMEPFPAPGRALAVVDYAHTPGALRAALAGLREHAQGRLWCVFGCGGERDAGKRPLMGAAAEQTADRLIITDDNPRGEDPDAIVSAIRDGLRRPGEARIIRDRATAIATALTDAVAGDIVLVAGKGHETEQVTATGRTDFSDREAVRRLQSGGAA